MKKILYAFGACLALASGSCTHKDDAGEKPVLAVSIEPQRKMLEEIVGDDYEVVTILSAGANPETYEPTVSQRKAAAKAKAYFAVGYLPFEKSFAKGLGDGTMVVNTSAGIVPVTGTHSHGHDDGDEHEGAPDPHVWTSLRTGRQMAQNMLDAVCAIAPENKDAYSQRFDAMAARLDSLDNAAAALLDSAGAHAFAIWHPSLSYYARDYGLHQIAVGQESKEMSPLKLRQIIDEAKGDSAKVFFFQKEYDSRQASNINDEIGSRLVIFNPLDYDWDNELMRITYELAR